MLGAHNACPGHSYAITVQQEFNRRFRHEMCVELVEAKVGGVAGEVVGVMLQLSRPHETRLQEERSAPLTESAIIASVAQLIADNKARHITSVDIVPSASHVHACASELGALTARLLENIQASCASWRRTRPR